MSGTETLHCVPGDHEWERASGRKGRKPTHCPDHQYIQVRPDPVARAARSRGLNRDDHVVTRAEVQEWARGLGFQLNNGLTGRAGEALVARYNREHPDRPYIRTVTR